MKALARSMVWWPGIDADLETKVKQCAACQANRKSPPEAPLHPWEWPSKPWSRLHVDFAGPFMGRCKRFPSLDSFRSEATRRLMLYP